MKVKISPPDERARFFAAEMYYGCIGRLIIDNIEGVSSINGPLVIITRVGAVGLENVSLMWSKKYLAKGSILIEPLSPGTQVTLTLE